MAEFHPRLAGPLADLLRAEPDFPTAARNYRMAVVRAVRSHALGADERAFHAKVDIRLGRVAWLGSGAYCEQSRSDFLTWLQAQHAAHSHSDSSDS